MRVTLGFLAFIWATMMLFPLTALAQSRVKVEGFEFEGNTQVTSEKLSTALGDLRGQELTFDELKAAADRLTDLYRQEGYFTVRAALPAQDVKDGVVKFSIIESKLGKVSVQGNERYSTEFINWYLKPVTESEYPDRHLLQRQLLLLNEFPELEVSSIVEAGEDPNTVDLIFDVVDDHPTHFTIDYNNFGSRFTGRDRIGATLDFGNLSGNGDRLTLRGLRSLASQGVTLGTMSYSVPVSNSGTKASFLLSNAAYAVGRELEILDIRGDAFVAGAFVSHPFIRTPDWNLDFNGGFMYQNINDSILDQTISRDRLRELVLGASTDWGDSSGRNYFNARMTQDLGTAFGGMSTDDPLSSRQAGGGFNKWNLDLARVQSFSPKWFGIARISHQFASRPLPTAEQYALGGIDSVRGYTQAAYLGDAGYNVSGEIRWQPIEGEDKNLLQLVGFIDHGSAYLKRPAVGEINNISLTGAGFGVRLNLPQETIIRADIGWALSDNALTDQVGKGPVTYLTFGKTF
ncbi:MAG: ShlB/FhaC/HecB family hemolysin secretion/activation protein [Candidatus Eremiobacteraeota bacterium]|nr:ShlB/FhaC/HecB family hemolysin secretion/activation protein [Candidatus Eremiobacteraeota bacterium]